MAQPHAAVVCVALACLVAQACAAAPHAPQPTVAPREPVRTEPARLEDGQPRDLRLPVDGTWIIVQGYQSADTHRGYAAYALDFVKLDERQRAHARSGKRLSDWHGFGADVLASADGIVVRARDHFPDNPLWGDRKDTNTVIVQHGSVFSEYVHLQRGSLRVRVGDRVTRGQPLARVGNSGCQTPHLHWALLSSVDPILTRPAKLERYEARDITGAWRVLRGIPSVGMVVREPR